MNDTKQATYPLLLAGFLVEIAIVVCLMSCLRSKLFPILRALGRATDPPGSFSSKKEFGHQGFNQIFVLGGDGNKLQDPIQTGGRIHSYQSLWVGGGTAGAAVLLRARQETYHFVRSRPYIPHPGNYSQIPTLPFALMIISTWWYCLCSSWISCPNSL